jgi:DNA-binding transcriptional ArsR family regulator
MTYAKSTRFEPHEFLASDEEWPHWHNARSSIRVYLQSDKSFYKIETMKSKEAITALSALASESRLAVYRLLVKRGPEGYTPSELVGRLDIPAPTLSFHLKGLVQAGLVVSRREARNLFYSPNLEHMNALVGFLTENCCSLADRACGSSCEPVSVPAQSRKRA